MIGHAVDMVRAALCAGFIESWQSRIWLYGRSPLVPLSTVRGSKRVSHGPPACPQRTSDSEGKAVAIRAKADNAISMSALGDKADVLAKSLECLTLARGSHCHRPFPMMKLDHGQQRYSISLRDRG